MGKFQLAGDGDILLDEIGDMDLQMQSKLLRVLESRELSGWVVVRSSPCVRGSSPRPTKTCWP